MLDPAVRAAIMWDGGRPERPVEAAASPTRASGDVNEHIRPPHACLTRAAH